MGEASRTRRWALALIVSLFFLWGVANNLNDVLVAHFRATFALSDLQSGLVQSAFYLGYFVWAVPAALVCRRLGYKGAVVVGLVLFGAGALLFVPAAQVRLYAAFLGALFVLASGLAFLETAANPLVAVLGPAEGAARRLTFAQAFNPLGSITGVLIGRSFILGGAPPAAAGRPAALAQAVQAPYAVIGAVVLGWALLVLLTPMPAAAEAAEPRGGGALGRELAALLRRPRFAAGLLAQFLYVGAQVGVWSFLIRYARAARPGESDRDAATWLTVSLVLFMLARFAGAAALGRVRGAVLLAACGAVAAALCAFAAGAPGPAGLVALTAASACMAVMYPTIFATSIAGLGAQTKLGASLLVMTVVGGAVMPAVMGRMSDGAGIAFAMLAPAAAFAGVALFGLSCLRAPGPARAAHPRPA